MHSLKQQIRKEVAAKRQALSEAFKQTTSATIAERLSRSALFKDAATVALYMYFGGEVRLDELFPICWAAGKRTCIPVYNERLKQYDMAVITEHTEFREGHYGIREPVSPTLIAMQDIDLMAVPGVAFDDKGNRLGRGGGFYDRMLSGFEGARIAVAFNFQIYDQIPTEPHDLPMDGLISETATFTF